MSQKILIFFLFILQVLDTTSQEVAEGALLIQYGQASQRKNTGGEIDCVY